MTSTDYQRAKVAFNKAIQDHKTLTSDDVWPYFDLPPLEPNVVGKVMERAAAEGIIVRVGQVKSKRRSAKGREIKVWQVVERNGLF